MKRAGVVIVAAMVLAALVVAGVVVSTSHPPGSRVVRSTGTTGVRAAHPDSAAPTAKPDSRSRSTQTESGGSNARPARRSAANAGTSAAAKAKAKPRGKAEVVAGVQVGAPADASSSFLVADAIGSTVALYDAPNVPMAGGRTMANPTWEGLPVVFLVKENRGAWLHVQVSARPNGMLAWVARSAVSLRRVPNRIVIELGARRITVFHGARVLLQRPVAVGRDGAPTPTGGFFVDGLVKLKNSYGPYGAFQVSVAAFSDVYQRFGTGIGQIAMHGTNQPQLVGQGVSHGCVRMTNDTITQVATLAPLGTPVTILA